MVRVAQEEKEIMLFWYTALEGNISAVRKKMKAETGIDRTRKVIKQVALRENFDTKAHLVRDKVNEYFYGTSNPWMTRSIKMGLDMLEIDEAILGHVKDFFKGNNEKKRFKGPFSSSAEALAAYKQVLSDISALTNEKDPKKKAFDTMAENEKPILDVNFKTLMDELPEEEQEELKDSLVLEQRNKLLGITS